MKSALIATDFSREAEAAVRRAASIAKETGLGGALAHVLPNSLPSDMQFQASSQAQKALAFVAGEMKREGLHFEPRLLAGGVAEALAEAARGYEMVVAGARGEDILFDFALGRTSTRLMRWSEKPTLIVKRSPEGPYRRVVAAVDFSEPSLAALACAIQIAPTANFNLVHAFEVEFESTMRRGGVTEDKIEAYREQAREAAMGKMSSCAARVGLPARQMWPTVTRGYPPRVILDSAEKENAELVVVGKHAAGIVERMLIGSVALQVLEMAKCDVLVVPEKV